MPRGVKECWYCGYKLSPPSAKLTITTRTGRRKTVHMHTGCLDTYMKSKQHIANLARKT